MNYYMVSYEIVNDCERKEDNIEKIIKTYSGSIRMLDNAYFIPTFQDNQTLLDKLSNGLDDDDKIAIFQIKNIIGKRIPNI